MLSHVQTTEIFAPPPPHQQTIPKSQDTGLYVFPNCTTGALMGVKCPLPQKLLVILLLHSAHAERKRWRPQYALSTSAAAKRIGISSSTLRRWVAKGWIQAWRQWDPDGFDFLTAPGYLFSQCEVEAYRLAKPRDL